MKLVNELLELQNRMDEIDKTLRFLEFTYKGKNAYIEFVQTGRKMASIWVFKEDGGGYPVYITVQELLESLASCTNETKYYIDFKDYAKLCNAGDITKAIEVSESSRLYKDAQKLINNGENYLLLYNRAVCLWNTGHYDAAVKIFKSFTEESEYYLLAQEVLNNIQFLNERCSRKFTRLSEK